MDRDLGVDVDIPEIADLVSFLRTLDCPGTLAVIGDQTVAGITPGTAAPEAKPAEVKPAEVKPAETKQAG